MEPKELGLLIVKLRKEKQITQAELGKRLNVTDKAVSRWERGLGFPDINTLEPLADSLGISLSELISRRVYYRAFPALSLVCARYYMEFLGIGGAVLLFGIYTLTHSPNNNQR